MVRIGKRPTIIITIKNFKTEEQKFSRVIKDRKLFSNEVFYSSYPSPYSSQLRYLLFLRSQSNDFIRAFVCSPHSTTRFREAPPTSLAPLLPFVPCFHYNRLFYSFAVGRHRWNGANNRESIRLARNGPVSCPYGQSSLSSTFQRRLFRW